MVGPRDENYEFQKIIVVLGFALLAVKFFAYYLTGSVAILTDALESIVNVVAACVGIFALYLSAQPADRNHPFGHGKIEIISATIEGTMIVVAGALILKEAVESFLHPGEISDLDVGLLLVAIAAVANYSVGRIAIRKGTANRSPALVASGKHLCSDTVSSVGILVGLGIVLAAQSMGYDARWLDSAIAGVFGLVILITGLKVVRECMDDAMDRADDKLLEDVCEAICECRHGDWIDVYNLRLIKYGPKIYVDVHVVLPRNMTISDQIGEKAEFDQAIRDRFGDSVEVSLSPVPCGPVHCPICDRDCPYRDGAFVSLTEWDTDYVCGRRAPRKE